MAKTFFAQRLPDETIAEIRLRAKEAGLTAAEFLENEFPKQTGAGRLDKKMMKEDTAAFTPLIGARKETERKPILKPSATKL